MPTEDDLLYKDYCKARTASIGFVAMCVFMIVGGLNWVFRVDEPDTTKRVLLIVFGVGIGTCGAVGGVAVRLGSRRWANLVYVAGWVYIWIIPIGTILCQRLMDPLLNWAQYLDRLRDGRVGESSVAQSDDVGKPWKRPKR